jgi:hypothetical protein
MKRNPWFVGALALLGLFLGRTLAWGSGERDWVITTLDTGGDVGKFADLQADAAGNLHVVYLRVDTGSLKLLSKVGESWGTPRVLDSSGTVEGYCTVAPTGAEVPVAYRRGDTGAVWYAGPASRRAWAFEVATAGETDDIGRQISASWDPDGEIAVACRNYTDGSLIQLRRQHGLWSTAVVDPGPARGDQADLAWRAGGFAFSEYAGDLGSLLLADPELEARAWRFENPTAAQEDDIGSGMEAEWGPGGELAIACRDATAGALVQLLRRPSGAWSLAVVDPGPARGTHCDLTHRAGAGYAFSEYVAAGGSVFLADPVIAPRRWTVFPTDAVLETGAQASCARGPNGRFGCAYLARNATTGVSQVRAIDFAPGSGFLVSVVADSISPDAGSHVHPDVFVSPGPRWHVSYRDAVAESLYYASANWAGVTASSVPGTDEAIAAEEPAPLETSFLGAIPNPTGGELRILYSSARATASALDLFDAGGRRVRRIEGRCRAGRNEIRLDGRDGGGRDLARGIYFLSLRVGDRVVGSKKISLLR